MSTINQKISIITVNYNNQQGLKKTIASVLNQTYSNYEYIIIDGGSFDGSKEIIEINKDNINYWVSEKDNGIYHAMNKGIKVTAGEYLYFLNSGDTLYSSDTLFKIFDKHHNDKLIIGNTASVNNNSLSVFKHDKICLDWFTVFNVNHQAVFFHKSVFEETGLYDESLKIFADHKIILETLLKEKFRYEYLNMNVCIYEGGGLSARSDLENLRKEEIKSIHTKYFNEDHWDYLKNVREMRSDYYNMKNSRFVKAGLYLSARLNRLKKIFNFV